MMRIKTAITTVTLLLALPAAGALAAPPKPLPNPDRAFKTPVTGESATTSVNDICGALKRYARMGNSRPSLRVKNLESEETICSYKSNAKRSLASNMKIFTTGTALGRLGPDHRFKTRVFATDLVDDDGVLRGSLYLKGGGDPSLGQRAFNRKYFAGAGTDIERLAAKVANSGIKKVTGRLYGDDTVFDRLRGVADSGYGTSPWIGPLSGLSINAGYTSASMSRYSSNPGKLATKVFVRALRKRGVAIQPEIAMKKTPASARENLVSIVRSENMVWMARLTNLYSNNFFAEMLMKNLGASIRNNGTTKSGAVVAKRFAAQLGADLSPVDGSGLTISNRSTTGDVVKMLTRLRDSDDYGDAFIDSLPTAGVDGTIGSRMRGSAAEGRCHAKTGTLTGVSALSGYCYNASGRKYVFSILMNGVNDLGSAHLGQDRIAAAIARL